MQREIPVVSLTNAERAIVGWTPALSPDGNTLAIYRALFDPETSNRVVRKWIEIWECEPPRLRSTFEGAYAPMSFSPDGRFLATGPPNISGDPETIKSAVVWDVAAGKKLFEFRRSAESMQAAKFDSTGCTIAATWAPKNRRGGSNTTTVFEWQTGAEEVTFDNTWLVEFLPGGESLLVLQFTGNGHWSINRWDRATASFRYHGYDLWHPITVVTMQLSPNGRVVAAPVGEGAKSIHPKLRPILNGLGLGSFADIPWSEELLLLNSENGRVLGRIPDTREVVFAPDSKTACSVSNREIRVWDIPPRKSLTWFATGAALLALPIAFVARRRVRRLRAA
jgi:WD40 repeat protein